MINLFSDFLTAFAVYFIIWWVTLFMVLPYGNRSQAEDGVIIEGTDPGAPTLTNLPKKLFWNSIIAFILFALYWGITSYFDWDFSDVPSIFPEDLGVK